MLRISAAIESSLLAHEHDEETPAEHHHHSASESHGAQEHREFKASCQFTCSNPRKLKVMDVILFSVFPGFGQLDSQILTTSRQSGAKLSAGNNRVEL